MCAIHSIALHILSHIQILSNTLQDTEDSGEITLEQLQSVFEDIRLPLSEQECDALVHKFGTNKDVFNGSDSEHEHDEGSKNKSSKNSRKSRTDNVVIVYRPLVKWLSTASAASGASQLTDEGRHARVNL